MLVFPVSSVVSDSRPMESISLQVVTGQPVFLVVVKWILILATHTTSERDKHKSKGRKATKHMS